MADQTADDLLTQLRIADLETDLEDMALRAKAQHLRIGELEAIIDEHTEEGDWTPYHVLAIECAEKDRVVARLRALARFAKLVHEHVSEHFAWTEDDDVQALGEAMAACAEHGDLEGDSTAGIRGIGSGDGGGCGDEFRDAAEEDPKEGDLEAQ